MNRSHRGANGQARERQAYSCVWRGSFCALRTWWKRRLVMAMIAQLTKKDAEVMEINQFRTVLPPAIRTSQ